MSLHSFLSNLVAFAAIGTAFGSLRADSLRPLPAAMLRVNDCDDSGRVLVGEAKVADGRRASRWTPDEGMSIVCRLGKQSHAIAVSEDGSTIVGMFAGGPYDSMFIWRAATGCIDAGKTPEGIVEVEDVSADGDVIVGSAKFTSDPGSHAFRTTFADARRQIYQDLGTLGGENSIGRFVSADGQVIAGVSQVVSGDWRVFRWTEADGMVDLGAWEGGYLDVQDMSDDGSVIVGTARNARGAHVPIIATPTGGVVPIPGYENYAANAIFVSDDGNLVFGDVRIRGVSNSVAYRYRLSDSQILTFAPWVEHGWVEIGAGIGHPRVVSGDGKVVSGDAEDTEGSLEPFLRVQGRFQGQITAVDDILHKVFESPRLSEFSPLLVNYVSNDGHSFVLRVRSSGYRYVHVQVDDYPRVIDENLFAMRPYQNEIAFWVAKSASEAAALREAGEAIEGASLPYDHASLAQAYQDICATRTLDGRHDQDARKQYAEYRYLAAVQSYAAYLYAYEVYTATGGEAEFAAETIAASYYAYDYQRLDLEDFLGG